MNNNKLEQDLRELLEMFEDDTDKTEMGKYASNAYDELKFILDEHFSQK